MADKTTEQRVIGIVADHFGLAEVSVTATTNIYSDLAADSLDSIELVMAMEDEFELEIPDDAAEDMLTVGDAIRYVEGRLAA